MTTLKERAELVTLNVFRCPHCTKVLGNTTDTTLYIGACSFKRTITTECGFCEKTVYWRPASESTKKDK